MLTFSEANLLTLKMATRLTYAEIVKQDRKNNKPKPNPPIKKTVNDEQQKLLKDTRVAENQNGKQLVQSPIENAQMKQKDSFTKVLDNLANIQLHQKVDKTEIEKEQKQNQTRLTESLLNALINPLIQAEKVKLYEFKLQLLIQPVFEPLDKGKVENKFILSESGYKFEDKYQLGSKLGEGGQGSVYTG